MLLSRKLLGYLPILLLAFIVSATSPCAAQPCTPIYQKIYGRAGAGSDEGLDVAKTADGGSIVVGRSTLSGSPTSAFLMKLSEQGTIQWVKTYSGSVFDELKFVKQTADGGYVALGATKSAAQPAGNAWIVRTDANGALVWCRQLTSATGSTNAKALVPLADGSFAVLINVNDSTVQSDAAVVKLGANGLPIWSKRFNNGADDGFLCAALDGDELLVGGYTTGNFRDGIVMRLRLSDGVPIWVKKVVRDVGAHDEVTAVAKTSNGITFATVIKRVTTPVSGRAPLLIVARLQGDSTIYRLRRYDYKGYDTKYNGLTIFTRDSGFLHVQNDSFQHRNAGYMKVGPTGNADWASTNVNNFGQVYGLYGADIYNESGYLLTGGYASFQTGSRLRVQVLKTNEVGRFGACSPSTQAGWADTVKGFVITPTSWTQITGGVVDATTSTPVISTPTFTEATICQDNNCEPANTTPPAACYTTFLAQYNAKYRFVPLDVARVDDGYIISGYTQQFGVEPSVMKVGLNGAVKWVKALNNYIHGGSFQFIRKSDDGNLLLAGSDGHVIFHGAHSNTVLVKMTPDGDVLWSRYLQGSPGDVQPTGDGSFTGLLLYSLTGGTSQVIKYKIDGAGNVTYRKCLKSTYEFIPFYRRMLTEGEGMYVAGEIYGHVAIEKLDSAGRRVWTQQFKIDDKSCIVEALHEIGDTIYTFVRVPTTVQFTTRDNLMLVKVGKDGGGIKGVLVGNPNLVYGSTWDYFFWPSTRIDRVAKTADGNFVFADRTVTAGDTTLSVTKLSPSGDVLWSKNYPSLNRHRAVSLEDDSGGLLVVGDKRLSDPNFYNVLFNPFLIRMTSDGDIIPDPAPNSECATQPIAAVSTPRTITLLQFAYQAPTPTFQWSEFNHEAYKIMERPLRAGLTLGCGLVGDCSFIDLTGPRVVCNRSDTVVYSVTKNNGCVVPALWRFDTARVQVVSQTDSSVTVRFKQYGVTSVRTQIQTGCGLLADSLQVSVMPPATTANLGTDTTICQGNTVQLNAGNRFAAYVWQDGSNDSTFAVTKPGTYWVTVTDGCGARFTDSVNVLPRPPIPFEVSPDRSKCNNDTLRFSAPAGFLNYSWSPTYNISATTGADVVANPSIDTTYFVKAEKTPGCFAYDTIQVRVFNSPPIGLGPDLSFCSGDSVRLDAGTGFSSYIWNRINGTRTHIVYSAGQYTVVGETAAGCKSYDTVRVLNVWPLPSPTLNTDSSLCFGASRTLTTGQFATYRWQDGSSSPSYTVTGLGTYWVDVVDNNGCAGSDTVVLTKLLPLPANFLPPDTAICSYGTLDLKALRLYTNYLWGTSERSAAISVTKPGLYWLEVVDQDGCRGRDTVVVNPKQCMTGVYIPTAFTPNRDGKNDVFRAMVFGIVKSFELIVYNRWGQIVYRTVEHEKGWDGKVMGVEQASGAFVWTCRYELAGGVRSFEKGTVTLVR